METTERVRLPWKAPHVDLTDDDASSLYDWTGYLTMENVGTVAKRIEQQFCGRWLVATSAHEYRGWQPEVDAPVRIEERREEAVYGDTDHGYGHVGFACGAYAYGWQTDMRTQPPLRFDEPDGHDRPGPVLDWMQEAIDRHRTPWLHFTDRSLTIKDRAPNGQAYWLRFDLLENRATRHTVLEPEETATVFEALSNASSLPHLDERIEARSEVMAHIDRVWADADGEKLERWLP